MPTLLKRPHQHILRTETLIRDRFPSGLASGHPATTLRQECAGIFLEQSELNSALWGHAAWQQSPRLLLARAGFPKAREPTGSGAVGSTAPPIGVTDPGCLLAPMRARTGLHTSSVHPTPDSHSVWWAEGAQQTPLGLLALLHVLNFALWIPSAGPSHSFSQVQSTKQALFFSDFPCPLVRNYYFGFCSLWTI